MFSATTEYALRAAVFLTESTEGFHTSHTVAQATRVPVQYMSKVLSHLSDAGLAIAQRGPSGGYALAKPAHEITLLEVVQAVEPIQRIKKCPLGLAEHAGQLCPLHQTMDDLARQAEETLQSKTLDDLVHSPIVPLGIDLSNGHFPINPRPPKATGTEG